MCRLLIGSLSLCAVLAVIATAAAGSGRGEQRKFNVADQAAARAATLKRVDLKPPTGWKGGVVKPDLSPPPVCPNYTIDLSSFVLTGAAATHWKRGFIELYSEADVLQNAKMVAQEWKLQIASPKAEACIKASAAKGLNGPTTKLVFYKRIAYPHLATFSRAYLARIDVTSQGVTVPVLAETVVLGKGRTELSLVVSGPSQARTSIAADAVRYGRILVGRIQA